ncbi:MAG TPA: ATP-binding cassette domain-containing protein [Thermoflexia bacterium]|nr:ATP-binding cassette domain-containing protein [Thermoflexia bacterium]
MLRLLKYLKPFLPLVLAAIVLLFVQANANLALPDYMSQIVNVGIQQGGVEEAMPEALRQTTMERLRLFLTDEEFDEVLAQYTLVDRSSPDYEAYLEKYPALAEEPIYVRTTSDPETIERLSPVMGRAMLIVFAVERIQTNPEQAPALMPGMEGFDLSQLPPGTDLFALLRSMPAERRAAIGEAMDLRFEPLGGEKAMVQAAARAVRAEYEALGMDVARIQTRYILRVGGEMLLVSLIAAVATIAVGVLAARTAAGLARDLRHLFFEKVMRFSRAELDRFSTASLITRSTNDITQIQTATMFLLRMVVYAPLIAIGALIRALSKSPSMWWIIGLAVGILIGLVSIAFRIAEPKFRLIQSLIDRLNRIARENLTGIMVVRAFNRERYEEERFDRANRDLTQTSLVVNRVFVVMMPAMMLLMNGVSVLIIWVGAHEVAQATMRIGDMMAFLQYTMQIVFAFMMLSMLSIMIPRANVAAQRVAEVLETEVTIRDPEEPVEFPEPFEPTIEFRGVCFRYPDAEEYVLKDITFTIRAGETVGIIGTTGSGKSTLINLIPRFYDVTEGAIYIDGVDIRRVRLSDLRDRVGYVPQRSNLFSGTIETNLRLAWEEADEEAMRRALEIAQAGDIIRSRTDDEGDGRSPLAAEVAQHGANFSGGQKQRLSIARALVKRPPIYIFDDSFSSLDYKTDARLRRALRKYVRGSTVIIVSQRVATIKDADRILVLDGGRLICQGTHEELMQTCEVYREIALSQLKLQEVLV